MPANVIDSKVVEMKFDNSKFEKNVKDTMSTLDKLKMSLAKLTGKSASINIDTSESNKGIQALGNTVESVANKFNALEAVAFGALAKIGSQAVVAGEQLVKSLTVDQISAGYSKYDEKTASVQTLVNSTGKSVEEINKYLDQLMWYSDETSYSFTEMTSALAQMTSTGGDIDKLIPTITGIANATAYAGKNGEAFVHTIRNLTQSYNAGYLQLMDWKSLNLAGTSSKQLTEQLIKAAEELGTVEKGMLTVENFAEKLKNKDITTDVMDLAFSRFSAMSQEAYKLVSAGKFETASEAIEAIADDFDELAQRAFKSAQEAKSFTEAIDATKDAVSSGWMNTFEIIFGNYEQAKTLWTDLANGMWDFFAGGAEGRNEKLADILGDNWDRITDRIEAAGISTEEFEWQIARVASNAGLNTDTIRDYYGSIGEWLRQTGEENSHFITEALYNMAYVTKEIDKDLKITEDDIKSFDKTVEKMAKGEIKNATTALKELSKAGFDNAETQKMVNEFYETGGKDVLRLQYNADRLKDTMLELNDAQVSEFGYTEEQLENLKELAKESNTAGSALYELKNRIGKEKSSGRDLLFDAVGNSLWALVDVIDIVKQAFSDIFPEKTAGVFYTMISRLKDATQKMRDFLENENNAEKLTRIFKGLFAVLDIIKTLVGGALRIGFEVFKAILEELGFKVFDLTADIGDSIVSFRDWIKEHVKTKDILEKIIPKVKEITKRVKSWFEEGGKLNKILKTTKDLLIKAKDAIAEWFKEFGESDDKVKFIFDSIKHGLEEGLPELLSYAGELIGKLFDGITDFFTNEEEGNLKDTGEKAGNAFKEGFWKALDLILYEIKDFGRNIIEKLKELPWEKIFAAGLAIATIYVLNKLSKWVETLRSLIDPLNALIDQVRLTFKSFSTMMKSIGKSLNKEATGDMILKVAIAIGVLVLAIKVLDTMDIDHVWQNVAVIAALMGIILTAILSIGAMIDKMSKDNPAQKVAVIAAFIVLLDAIMILMAEMTVMALVFDHIKNIGQVIALFVIILLSIGGLIALAGALATKYAIPTQIKALLSLTLFVAVLAQAFTSMATALFIVSLIKNEDVWKAIAFCVIFAGFIAAFIWLSTKVTFAWIAAKSFALGVLAIAGAFLLTATAVKIIGSLDKNDVLKGAAFLLAYGYFLKVLSTAVAGNKYDESIKEFSKMALKLSAAMLLTAIALKIIASMEWKELFKSIAFMGVFLGYIWILAKITEKGKGTVEGFGKLMIGLGVALILMSIAVKILGSMKVGEIIKGMAAITLLALVMRLLVGAFKGFEKEAPKLAASLIGAAIAIGILALVVFLIGQLKVETLAKGIIAVGFLTAFVKGLIKATKDCNPASTGAIIALAVIIMTIAAALVILTLVADDWKSLAVAAAALGAVILALGFVIKNINNMEIDKSVMITLGILAAIMLEIGIILYLLATVPNPLGVLESALGMAVVLLACAAALWILKDIKASDLSVEVMVSLAVLVAMVGLIGLVLGELQKLGLDVGLEQAVALSVLLLAMAACLRIIAPIGAIGIPAIEAAVLGLVTLVAGIGAVLELLGLGALALMTAASAVLPLFGLSIMAFWLAVKPFLDYVSSPEVLSAVEGIAAFCSGMESLVSAAWKDKVAGWMKVDIVEFANKFASLGEPLGKFVDCIKLLNDGDLEKADIASQILLKLCDLADNLPKKGGLKGLIFGNSDFAQFIEDVGNLGPSIIKFSKNTAGITDQNLKSMENAIAAVQKLAELANALPKYGGKISEWFGDKMQMSTFSTQIQYFGTALAAFSTAVSPGPASKGVNKYYMDKGIDAGMRLSDLANNLPSTSGKIGEWFDGTQLDMGTFATQLEQFGEALVNFSSKCDGLSYDNLDKGITAAVRLGDLAVALGGVELGTGFTGKVATLGGLGDDLGNLGVSLQAFHNSLKGISVTTMDMIVPIISKIVDILLKLSDFEAEDIDSFVAGVTALSTLEFDNLVSGIKNMSDTGKNIVPESFERFYDALNKIADICVKLGAIYVDGGKLPDLSLLGAYMQEFANYLDSVQEIAKDTDFTLIGQVNGTISILAAILKNINAIETENVEAGIMALNKLKDLDLNEIIKALQVSEENQSMSIDNGISPLMTTLATGIINGIDLVRGAFEQLFNTLLEYVPTRAFEFNTAAFHLMDTVHGGFGAGIAKSKDTILYELKRLLSTIIIEVKNEKYQDFYQMGEYFVKGLAAGIRENARLAYEASKELANGVKLASQNTLEIESPSKLARRFGQYWDEGLMLGIKDYENQVYDTATHLSESTITGFKTAFDGIYDVIDWDMYPVITPTLDLSYVEAGTARINKLFENKKLNAEAEVQNGVDSGKDQPTYNFTQNNYSPKALSRIEIYRQTNNLISAARGR